MKGKAEKDILADQGGANLVGEKKKEKTFSFTTTWFLALLVFLLAISVRLVFLYFFTNPDRPQVGDVWHHWQVAYLSMTIGFKHGFLRLWDFKGMEYYWGLLHPLVLMAGFIISRSVSIIVPRVISALFGSGVIALIFLIVSRYFNKKAALAAAIFLSLLPIAIFHDTLGLQEPLGLFFLVLAVYLFPRHLFATGFSLMLAGMVRAEYWLFGAVLVLVILLREKNFDRKVMVLLGYGLPCLFYLKYLLDYTGNPIYPIYWNFLGVSAGKWSPTLQELSPRLQSIKLICQIFAGFFFISGLAVFWKKFKSYLFWLLGLTNLAFIFAIHGFGVYLHGYDPLPYHPGFVDLVWIGKLFAFPWGFLGTLTAIFLLYFLPQKLGKWGTVLGLAIFLVGLGATQFIWPTINVYYLQSSLRAEEAKKTAEVIASQDTGRGTIVLPEQSEFITYFLVYDQGIPGDRLVSSFYDPFYYYQGKDPFSEWDTFREEIVEWLRKNKVELLVIYELNQKHVEGFRNYSRMIELEEGKLFEFAAKDYVYTIFRVKTGEP
ncbi:hypothetical protein A2Z41_02370 [Microgenomates group bacterium RBG_19FT_COMBO_39_10]|nr:MAG: hypothetical protein A2Z41_02370 [Microgenomates group bacterium RBG_19FT_COMBO_39_10]